MALVLPKPLTVKAIMAILTARKEGAVVAVGAPVVLEAVQVVETRLEVAAVDLVPEGVLEAIR
jgi:sulfur carrier protein ThiS